MPHGFLDPEVSQPPCPMVSLLWLFIPCVLQLLSGPGQSKLLSFLLSQQQPCHFDSSVPTTQRSLPLCHLQHNCDSGLLAYSTKSKQIEIKEKPDASGEHCPYSSPGESVRRFCVARGGVFTVPKALWYQPVKSLVGQQRKCCPLSPW